MKALGEPRKKEQVDVYSPLQAYAILRLSQAIALSRTYLKSPDKDPFMVKVLNKGLYSYFRDCQDQGVGEEAKVLMKTINQGEQSDALVNKSILTPQTN